MEKFVLFNFPHLLTIGIGFFTCFLLIFLGFFIEKKEKLAKFLAVLIFFIKIAELVYRHYHYGEKVTELLPFHLCNIVILLSIIMMFFHSEEIYQPVYFWSIGAFFAILMPELRDGMSNFASQSFFITHFFILFSTAYAFVHFRFRPSKSGFIGSFIILSIISFIMYFINNKLGTNYLYVNRPPAAKSLVDLMGPWPNYIYSVMGIYIVISFFMYLPFRAKKKGRFNINTR